MIKKQNSKYYPNFDYFLIIYLEYNLEFIYYLIIEPLFLKMRN